ncbi:MAG TPA: LPXTG cell wall anchor domain-containing protein [Candidatus Deferrimicrobium sp.]|nr:LPXTG cell wall anchor domain-containing protein [Candidatus Deferrimicrobium sp.]
MTDTPIEMPLSAAGGQSSLAEQLEERPWLLAVGALALLGFFLVLRRRDAD